MGAGCSRPPELSVVPAQIIVPHPSKMVPERRHTADSAGVKSSVLPGRECAMGRPLRSTFAFAVCNGVRYAKHHKCSTGWAERHKYALEKLRNACKHWIMRDESLSFAISLGNITETGFESDTAEALKMFEKLGRSIPNYHAFGPREAMAKSKKEMLARLGLNATYYSRRLPCDWKLIVLDTTQACRPFSTSRGIMTPHQGVGIGTIQLQWLKAELEIAEELGERAIIAAHDALIPGLAKPEHSIGDSREVAEVILGSKASQVVLCSGDSAVPYYREKNVHFLGITSMVAGPCATLIPYYIIEIGETEIGVRGFGGQPDRLIDLQLERRKTRLFQSRSFSSLGETLKGYSLDIEKEDCLLSRLSH